MFLNLLAVIHRDGGHYVGKHGVERAVTDAQAEVVALRAEVARLREALTGTRAVLDELDPHPESIIGRVLTLVEMALKEAGDGNRET